MPTIEEQFADVIIDKGDDEKILEVMKFKWDEAKQYKTRRNEIVQQNLSELLKIEQRVSDYSRFFNRQLRGSSQGSRGEFISPLMAAVMEKKSGADWVPTIVFQPQQQSGPGADVFLARNANRVHDMILDDGKFYTEAQKGSIDLFAAGRCYIQKAWRTQNNDGHEIPSFIKFRQREWAEVYHTKDMHHWFILTDYTYDELLSDFGPDIKGFSIKEGMPFTADDKTNGLDFSKPENRAKRVKALQYFTDTGKAYGVAIGGGGKLFDKATGDNYPWADEYDNGYVPIDYFDGHEVKSDGFPLSDIDYIVHIWRSYSIYFSAVIERAKKSARSREIIASNEDPVAARKLWMQSEMDWADGYDIPYFAKLQGIGDTFSATKLDIGVDTGNPLALRDMFYDEIEMVVGVNLRALGRGAPTAEQERLRVQRELDSTSELIKINTGQWERFSLTNMQMSQGVDSAFLKKYVEIEDEISDDGGLPMDGVVGDVIKDLKGFPFNVRVSINHSNEKRRQIELMQQQEALTTLAPFFPGAKAIGEMAVEVATQQFPNLKFNAEQFTPTMAPGVPAMAPGPKPAPQLG